MSNHPNKILNKTQEFTEKWSQKYKRSIDCNNPKGFSQRAHCQGKKKRDLDEYARTLKMARRQGVGTRFPKSAVKANPDRFRNYTKEMNEESLKYLDKIVELCSLLSESKKPDFEWEFDVKKNIEKSIEWVKSKSQAISYIKTLFDKIKNVSENLKHKILRYVIYSFVGLFTITQMNNMYDDLTKETPNLNQIEKFGGGEKEKKDEKIRDYDERLINHMKYEEGSITKKGEPVLIAYDINDGAKTIGYGHAIFKDASRGSTGGDYPFLPKYNKIIVGKTKITKKQAEQLLRDDIDKAKVALNKILDNWEKDGINPEIDQNMYNAMISMIYNMGIGNFRTSEFIQYVKRNEMDKAKEQIKKESSRSFHKFPGLKDRRQRESEMFGGGQLNESEEKSSSLKNRLKKLIKDGGIKRAISAVGGVKNLVKIFDGSSIIKDNIKPPYGFNMWKLGLSHDEQLSVFKAIFGDDIDVWGYNNGGDIYVENSEREDLYYEDYDGKNWKIFKPTTNLNEGKIDKNEAKNFVFRRIEKYKIDDAFFDAYNYYAKGTIHPGRSFYDFKKMFITMMIDYFHFSLIDGFSESDDIYQGVVDLLDDMYEDQIEDLFYELTEY